VTEEEARQIAQDIIEDAFPQFVDSEPDFYRAEFEGRPFYCATYSGSQTATDADGNPVELVEIVSISVDEESGEVSLAVIFADLEVSGRVGFYGLMDRGSAWMLLNALDAQLEDVKVYGDFDVTLIDAARATKDANEAERIREIGRRTCAIVARTVEFLQSHQVKDEVLVQPDGSPLTIGRVHKQINRFIAEQQLEDPEGFIFSIGRDAGIPHSKGTPDDVLALGKTIVFDIFPREAGGGYFFDMTRTLCLGYAPPEVEKAYQDVYECMEKIIRAYEVGTEARRYQQMTCEFFESQGHPTVASDTKAEVGYVHSLGHGLGLAVHEEPRFADVPSNTDVLQPGHVFTCEPGLYYPDRGFGMRIEDVLWIDPEGTIHNLTDFPKELVIEL